MLAFGRVLVALGLLAMTVTAEAVITDREKVRCVGCHGGTSRAVVDPKTGKTRDVYLDMVRYRASDHGKMDCVECHVRGFTSFPHSGKKILSCMDCHPREDAGAHERQSYPFREIEREFKQTVHFTEHEEEFTCGECHNPHSFQVIAHLETPRLAVETHNAACLRCHAADATGPLADPAKPNLVAVHAWLPQPKVHLHSTRCIDCHRDTARPVSHLLRVGNDAERGCASCHTQESVLVTGLYRHITEEAPPQAGFTNTVILREAYVMGATRHALLDKLSYLLVGGALLFVAVHAGLRIVRRKRRRTGEEG